MFDIEINRGVLRRIDLRKWYPPYYDEGCYPVNLKRSRSNNKVCRPIYSVGSRSCRTWKRNRMTRWK